MDIVRSWRETPPDLKSAVLAIGNFDGVHRGHQAVLGAAKEIADSEGLRTGAVIFEPHPREFFAPGTPFFRLTPLPVKLELLEALGLDVAFVLPFDRALSQLGGRLRHGRSGRGVRRPPRGGGLRLHLRQGTCAGSVEHLTAKGETQGYRVDIVEPVRLDADMVFSSSAIREHLSKGRVRPPPNNLAIGGVCAATCLTAPGAVRGSAFPRSTSSSCPVRMSVTVSTPCVCTTMAAVTMRRDISGRDPHSVRRATAASKPFCSTFPAISTDRRSRWSSSTSSGPDRHSQPRTPWWQADGMRT